MNEPRAEGDVASHLYSGGCYSNKPPAALPLMMHEE